jgi:DNA-binding MarR family transcriptional regulator
MTDPASRVWDRMRELVNGNDRRRQVVDALGMSFVKTKALRRLAAGPMTLSELADELMTDRPYTTVLVDHLEQRGLVVRTVHPADRRSKLVSLTPAGRAAAVKANRILSEPPAALRALSAGELAALAAILDRIAE